MNLAGFYIPGGALVGKNAAPCVAASDENVPVERSGHRIVVANGHIWLVGGFNPALDEPVIQSIRCFSIAESKWLPVHPWTGNGSETMASHCAKGHGPFIFVHGGSKLPFGTTERNSLYVFDTRSHVWEHLDADLGEADCIPRGVYGHSMCIIDGVIYILGGTTGTVYFSDVYSFDLNGPRKWVPLFTDESLESATMDYIRQVPTPRYRHECVSLGRFIFMIGGGTSELCNSLQNIHFFDTKTNKWDRLTVNKDVKLNAAPTPRRCLSVAQFGSTVLVLGGTDGYGVFDDIWKLELNPSSASAAEYSPVAQTLAWEHVGTMAEAAFFHDSAIDERNGTVYTFGGSVGPLPSMANAPPARTVQRRSNLLSVLHLFPSSLYRLAEQTVHRTKNYSDSTKTFVKEKQLHKIGPNAGPKPA